MTAAPTRRRIRLLATLVAVGSLAAGCALGADQAEQHARQVLAGPTTTSAPATTTTTAPDCDLDHVAPAPPPPPPDHLTTPTLETIRNRGSLRVGVDQNSLRLSAFNPASGFSGLEIDLLGRVADAIFGPGHRNQIEYRVILSSQREDAIRNGTVDIVADAVTKTCGRMSSFAFSNTYLEAEQKLLVRSDSKVTSIADLTGKKVCATTGSTSKATLERAYPDVEILPVAARTDCLVALQQGLVDAVTSDSTILQGLHDQDPHTKIVGPSLEPERYGMLVGLNGQHQDLADLVNGVLAQLDTDHTLQRLTTFWLNPDQTPAQLAEQDQEPHVGG